MKLRFSIPVSLVLFVALTAGALILTRLVEQEVNPLGFDLRVFQVLNTP